MAIVDPTTIDPNIVFETPLVQGKLASRETKIADEEAVKAEQAQELKKSKEINLSSTRLLRK